MTLQTPTPLRCHILLRAVALAAITGALALPSAPVAAQTTNDTVLEAREALRKRDKPRLAATRAAALAANHPLAMWPDYWELGNRLADAQQDELNAFYARWPGTYVEDRLRNDWLLELGRRRDWGNFRAEYPRFKLDDDREVRCYALLTRHLDGQDVTDDARAAWFAQRDADDGCALLASTLFDAKRIGRDDVWRKTRLAVEANRPRMARQAAALLGDDMANAVSELNDNPQRYLTRKAATQGRGASELTALALIRSAANDPDVAATAMNDRWAARLPADLSAWVWASIGKQAALKLSNSASDHFQRAELTRTGNVDVALPDDTLAWKLRAALRANNGAGRWQQVMQAVTAMSSSEQREPAWIYWKARALQALAGSSQDGVALGAQARELLASIASPLHFYGKLAMEDLGQPLVLPAAPAPLTPEERNAAAQHPGLKRALLLIELDLRSEGVREWNFSLFGMGERELLAAAQLACERQVWDRCINTSERTREQVDMAQRFPTPYRSDVVARAREAGLDPAYVYGLIRQESRFITSARSSVGASGLMQLMPATARWTARKLGIDYTHDRITEHGTNLRLGTGYLKMVLDSFDGSQAMAAAGYNAGPNRPRKWREGPSLDAAAWAENIPFTETRDYVKKVLSNATDYAALLSGQPQSLRARLGGAIGPHAGAADPAERELP
ncbi:lytic transglycosylase domain-containing protein [Methylibium petroleiphilum]|uniref:Putative transglycosylase n=1 Tax=Methylibium petroleiphilum (strain ATCC BAA-1232 / LMG 22953 / PM1) TaxID=420662 RepID=A2SL09_METPP|nr:lytic transglycosylase domain-containing protein [Methylibium petroleiphilum]ABM96248.1 putative transglycosylase [Methylibium petroleiphilum PM1]